MNLAPDIFASFLPRILRQRVVAEGAVTREPRAVATPVATLFADLSGFTKLTVDLSKQGRRGSERVSNIVNASFRALIDAIGEHGGDVLTLSGDAVLAIWPAETAQDMEQACHRAACCAVACLSAVDALPEINGRRLGVKVLLSAGDARLMDVGGLDNRWLFLAAGEALQGLSAIGHIPKRGQIVANARAWSHLQTTCTGESSGDGWLIDSVEPLQVSAVAPPPAHIDDIPALRPWLAPPVMHVLDAGQPEWAAELRRVSVLFVNIPRIALKGRRQLAALNRAIVMLQSQLKHYQGAFQDLVQDDKGLILMASWGVPPFSHENDALRAVLAALGMQEALGNLKLEHTIGVATGDVFSGFYGNDNRRQHAVVGAAVNRAARLMQAAQGGLLCDPETARLAGDRVRFVAQQPIELKGFPQPVAPLRPLWAEQRTSPTLRSRRGDSETIVGREAESEVLTTKLEALANQNESACVILQGEAGIGKSMLAARLLKECEDHPVRPLVGIGDDVERRQAWFALRPILEDLLDLQHVVDPGERRSIALERLAGHPELLEWAPLLNDIVPLGLPDNNTTLMMSGAMRFDALTDLALFLLAAAAEHAPLVLLADDGHWIDSASWRVFRAAYERVSPVLLVVSTRPDSGIDALDGLISSPNTTTLELAPFSATQVAALVADSLGARTVSAPLLELVSERTEGNPFFVEEFAQALRQANMIEVRDGKARLVSTSTEMQILTRDGTLGAIITTRLDGLPAALQQLLKVASVLGRSSSRSALNALTSDSVDLSTALPAAETAGLIRISNDGSEWAFRHALIQEAAYMLATFGQRTALHARAAAFFQEEMDDEHFGGLGLLAHHYVRAEQFAKGVTYLERAALEAINTGANREAIQFVEQAHAVANDHTDAITDDAFGERRALWSKIVGNARLALGNLDGADASLRESLALLDVHLPSSGIGLALNLAKQATWQAFHLVGLRVRTTDEGRVRRLAEAARVSSLLSQVRYFQTDIPGWVHTCLTALNLAERADMPQAAGRAYGGIGNLAGTLGLRKLARRYFTRAEQSESAGGLLTRYWAESVVVLTQADWVETRRLVGEGLSHAGRVGHRYEEGIGLTIQSYTDVLQGDLASAIMGFNQVLGSARTRENPQHEGWALTLMVPVLVAMDCHDEAASASAQAAERLEHADPLSVPIHYGTSALALHHAAEPEASLVAARQALSHFSKANPVYTYIPGLVGMLDVLLHHWSQAQDHAPLDAAVLANEVKAGVKAIGGFARLFSFAKPYHLLYTGLLDDGNGRRPKALSSLRKARDLAGTLGLVQCEAHACRELGQRTVGEERATAFARSEVLYTQMNATYELRRLAEVRAFDL